MTNRLHPGGPDRRTRSSRPACATSGTRCARRDFVARGGMKKVRRLGEDWLLFRQSDGTLRMLADRCPHRGAPLSLGKHLGDRIAC